MTPLYLSLSGENAAEAAFEGSYVDVVTTSIAAISRETAVPQSLAILNVSQGNQIAADRVIWGTVLRKVGANTVGCLCEIIASDEKPETIAFYIMILQALADRNALGDKKEMALETVQKARTHADDRVRKAAEEALASISG